MKRPEKLALAAVLTLAASAAGAIVFAQSAEAHTPGYQANCEGVYAEMVNTPRDFESTISVYVKGVGEESSTGFGDHSLFVGGIPQDGSFYDWAVDIDSPSGRFELHVSGEVGPCGVAPTVPPVTEEPSPEPTPTPTPTPEPTPEPEPEPSLPPSLIPPTHTTAPPQEQPPTSTTPACVGGSLQWTTTDSNGTVSHHSDASAVECERKADEAPQNEEGY